MLAARDTCSHDAPARYAFPSMLTRRLHRVMAAVVIVAAGAIDAGQEPVSIGLVREDGYLVPIVTITPKLFESPLPAATTVNGEPLSPVEPAEKEWPFRNLEWRLYGRGKNGTPVMPPARPGPPLTAAAVAMSAVEIKTEIKTIEPLTVDSHCSDQAVWRTTLTLPPAPENVAPIRKIAVAIAGGVVEQPEDVVGQPDAASRRVARRIVQLTHAKETERVADMPSQYLPPDHSPAARAKVAVRLAQLRRLSIAGVATYYFEAHKAWGPALDGGLVTGWIVATPSGVTDHDVKYKFNDDSSKENDSAIVWGVVKYQGRSLWILEWHGYELEYYTIHDWPSGVERLQVDGGGC